MDDEYYSQSDVYVVLPFEFENSLYFIIGILIKYYVGGSDITLLSRPKTLAHGTRFALKVKRIQCV